MSTAKSSKVNIFGSVILSTGIILMLFFLLAKETRLWSNSGALLLNNSSITLLLAIFLILSGYYFTKKSAAQVKLNTETFLVGLFLIFISDWLNRPYNLLQGPSIRGEVLLFATASFIIFKKHLSGYFFVSTLILSCLIFMSSFLTESAGRLLFVDDHTVFLHRLYALKENFPFIPFYDPYWNAGNDARDFFATGALNFFTIFSPLIYNFEISQIYNFLIALLLFFLTPLGMFLAARLANFSIISCSIASILSISSSLLWYRWALQYGTLGFLTTLSLVPLNLVISAIILDKKSALPLWLAILFIFTTTLMLMWSLSGIAFIPIIAAAVFSLKRLIKKQNILLTGLALILLNLPWMITFWSVSKVSEVITKKSAIHTNLSIPEQNNEVRSTDSILLTNLSKSLKVIRETALSSNPLIIIFTLPALFLLEGFLRWIFLLMTVWLLIIGGLLYPLNPRLELDRMLLILVHILSLPVAVFIENIGKSAFRSESRLILRLGTSLVYGFLFAGIFSAAGILHNRSLVQFTFAEKEVSDIANAIKSYNQGGRILFSGFVLHELNNGHLAPLTNFTHVPLMASSQVHNLWRYKQIFPEEFLARGDQGIQEYLDLYNIGAVFAHEKEWRDYFSARPEKYSKVFHTGRFDLFTRTGFQSNYIVDGEAQIISQDLNGVRIKINSSSVIIKFNYYNFLEAAPCKVEAHQSSPSVKLVKLVECPVGSDISLKAGSLLKRIGLL